MNDITLFECAKEISVLRFVDLIDTLRYNIHTDELLDKLEFDERNSQ